MKSVNGKLRMIGLAVLLGLSSLHGQALESYDINIAVR
jgi:hypothetical protein